MNQHFQTKKDILTAFQWNGDDKKWQNLHGSHGTARNVISGVTFKEEETRDKDSTRHWAPILLTFLLVALLTFPSDYFDVVEADWGFRLSWLMCRKVGFLIEKEPDGKKIKNFYPRNDEKRKTNKNKLADSINNSNERSAWLLLRRAYVLRRPRLLFPGS